MIKGVLTQAITTARDIWTGDYPRRPIATFDTPAHAERFFGEIVDHVRGHMRPARDAMAKLDPVMKWAAARDTFVNGCSMAQSSTVHNLHQLGIEARPLALAAIGHTPFVHYASVVPYKIRQQTEKRFALIDKTFGQFELPVSLYEKAGWFPFNAHQAPSRRMKQSDAGSEVWDCLIEKGFCEMSPRHAQAYLGAFFADRPTPTRSAAFNVIARPPQYGGNMHFPIEKVKQAGGLGFEPSMSFGMAQN